MAELGEAKRSNRRPWWVTATAVGAAAASAAAITVWWSRPNHSADISLAIANERVISYKPSPGEGADMTVEGVSGYGRDMKRFVAHFAIDCTEQPRAVARSETVLSSRSQYSIKAYFGSAGAPRDVGNICSAIALKETPSPSQVEEDAQAVLAAFSVNPATEYVSADQGFAGTGYTVQLTTGEIAAYLQGVIANGSSTGTHYGDSLFFLPPAPPASGSTTTHNSNIVNVNNTNVQAPASPSYSG